MKLLTVAVAAALTLAGCGDDSMTRTDRSVAETTTTATQGSSTASPLRPVRRRLAATGYRLGPAAFEPPVVASHEIRGRRKGKWFIAAYVAAFGERDKAIAHLRASRRLARESDGQLVVDGVGRNFYWIASGDGGPLPTGRLAAFHRVVAIAEARG